MWGAQPFAALPEVGGSSEKKPQCYVGVGLIPGQVSIRQIPVL